MKCNQIQEFILTDYSDGQLEGEALKNVEQHLLSCPQCREFSAAVRQLSVEPFLKSNRPVPSQENVWRRIREGIEAEPSPAYSPDPLSDTISKLKQIVWMPRPALALLAVAVIVLITAVQLRTVGREKAAQMKFMENKVTYLAYVADELSINQTDESDSYGTAIEEYFL